MVKRICHDCEADHAYRYLVEWQGGKWILSLCRTCARKLDRAGYAVTRQATPNG